MKRFVLFVLCLAVVFVVPASAKLPSNVVFLMTFENGSGGVVSDISGHGNDGTIEGSVEWGAGVQGGAIHFDGQSHVTVPNAEPLSSLSHPMSVGAWVNPDILGGWRVIIEMDGGAGWKFGFQDPDHLVWTTYHIKDFSAADPIELGVWTHVAATWDGSEAVVYVNGEEDSASPIAGGGVIDVSAEPSLDLGYRSTSGSSYYEGWMDEVWVADDVLSQGEIQDMMDGLSTLLAVEPGNKAAVTWSELKSY